MISYIYVYRHAPHNEVSVNDGPHIRRRSHNITFLLLLLLLLLSSSSSSLSPLCRVFIHVFPRQTVSLGNTLLQLFCRYCLWCLYVYLVPALALLYFYVSTFRCTCAVPNMAVFCSSLTSWFPGMLLTYFLNYFEIVPVTPIITGISIVFIFHMRCISVVRSIYFKIFSASF
jgi:hypothetical protein